MKKNSIHLDIMNGNLVEDYALKMLYNFQLENNCKQISKILMQFRGGKNW